MKAGTLLRTIANHGLWLQCRACGHEANLPVAELLEQVRSDAVIRDVLHRLKCTKCRGRQIGEYQIVSPEVMNQHGRSWTAADQQLPLATGHTG